MITTLQFDIQTAEQRQKLQMVLEYVATIKLPFHKKDSESNTPSLDDPHIVWAFPEPDLDFQNLGLSSIADDWACPEEWAELSKTPTL